MFADIGATAGMINARIGHLGMAADAQDFIQAQLQEFEQTVNSQRKQSAQSVEVRHYLCDHLGTPHALLNHEGEMEWAAQLDAWGNVQREYNPKRRYQPIRLPGQHEDEVTYLYYNRHRYYTTESGGYINQDPVGLVGGWNLNIYSDDPISFIDPFGLSAVAGALPIAGGLAAGDGPLPFGDALGLLLLGLALACDLTKCTSKAEEKKKVPRGYSSKY